MPFQHGQKLVFKTQLAVVLLLRLDVLPDRGHLGHADGERAVAGLPFKFHLKSLLAVYPFRRVSFDVLQHLRNGDGRAEARQDVDVVRSAANLDEVSLFASDNTADVREQIVSQPSINAWFSVLGAEDDVVGKAGVRTDRLLPFDCG